MNRTIIPAAFLSGLLLFIGSARTLPAVVLTDYATFWQPYQTLLDKYLSPAVREGIELTVIDYGGIKSDPAFAEMTRRLEKFPRMLMKPGKDALAFWINAYNFLAIKIVIDHYPVKSIKDIGSLFTSVWKKEAGRIGEKSYYLDQIENKILRKNFAEPRIHFSIVCASLSCPDLRSKVYLPSRLEEQLESAARSFLNNPAKGVRLEGQGVKISRIFKWYGGDFEPAGGRWKFIRKYRPDLGPEKDYSVGYLPYDWRLNENLTPSPSPRSGEGSSPGE